jgi:uncharacterized membrane protein YedE/YeeE
VWRAVLDPWPWWVAGPLIGLTVPALLLLGNKPFGVSSTLRHACAAVAPCGIAHFTYDWKKEGAWNLAFVLGILLGGFLAGTFHDAGALVPSELFRWSSLLTARGVVILGVGGLLVGFGTAWAGGCTSGHGIAGMASRDPASMVALAGFFAGGLLGTWVLLPALL